jgi:di/tricarboxylate transporter
MGALWKIVKNYRSQLVLILTPLILLPLALKEDIIENVKCNPSCDNCQKVNGTDVNDVFTFPGDNEGTPYKIVEKQPYKCLFCLGVMATYWTFEATPLAVTSLMPMFLFPMFGLLPAATVAAHYFKDINFLFFGGLVVAIAIEKCNLHLRIALSVMKIAGAKLHTMMGAFMFVTAFLSMWISNTATTAMMLPIAVATVKTITGEDNDEEASQNSDPEVDQGYDTKIELNPVSNDHLADGFDNGAMMQSGNSLTVTNNRL